LTEETWTTRLLKSLDTYTSEYGDGELYPPDVSRRAWVALQRLTESEIEQLLGMALLWLGYDYGEDPEYPRTFTLLKPTGEVVFERKFDGFEQVAPRTRLTIIPQYQMSDWRVDFLLIGTRLERDYQNMVEHSGRLAGTYRPGRKVGGELCVVVECDGHEFHERTKEQAARDRSRDRSSQTKGHKVMRFTGSEIWADAFACAEEALHLFENEY